MRNFDRSPSRGRDNREDRQMHSTTCSACGTRCEVPFKPTSSKPVYCNNCFKKDESPRRDDRGGRDFGKGRDDSRGRDDRGSRDFGRGRDDRGGRDLGRPGMHKATCEDCGKNCEVPFKPSGSKPVYCSNCFEKGDAAPRSAGLGKGSSLSLRKPSGSGENMSDINAKLDKILFLLQGGKPAVKEAKKEAINEFLEEAPKAKKLVKKSAAKTDDFEEAVKAPKLVKKVVAKKEVVKKVAAKKAKAVAKKK